MNRLSAFPHTNISTSWSLHAPNGKSVELHFVNPGYVSKRIDFDKFLLDLVKEKAEIDVLSNFKVESITERAELKVLKNDRYEELSARLLIACDGAHSIVAKKLSYFKVDLKNYSGAVRAYYKNVAGVQNSQCLEIHLLKDFLPGYFWIFPLNDNTCNVGFGMLSDDIRKRRIDLKLSLKDIIRNSPSLASRFRHAEAISPLEGFGLPLGGIERSISGEGYMLCGDAASLIDPLNGEGIGNAMWSGYLAARQAERCFNQNNFSGIFMSAYDKSVYSKLGKELKLKLCMQKAFNRTWLINMLVNLAIAFPGLKNWFGKRL